MGAPQYTSSDDSVEGASGLGWRSSGKWCVPVVFFLTLLLEKSGFPPSQGFISYGGSSSGVTLLASLPRREVNNLSENLRRAK